MALTLTGVPTWGEQGPGPTQNGQVEMINGNNPVVGAVEAVVADPGNADTLYVAAVNGGIWKAANATVNPAWTPLTDRYPSLSFGALAMDPTDNTNQTLVAGFGRFSNFGSDGGAQSGLLKTTDGGATWTMLGGVANGLNITAVVPRGNTILVAASSGSAAANGGLYRSVDGGATFQRLSGAAGVNKLGSGIVYDVLADPAFPNRFLAAVGGSRPGIYMSTNNGDNWTNLTDTTRFRQNTTLSGALSAATSNIRLAVHYNPATNTRAYYIGVVNNIGGMFPNQLANVFRAPASSLVFTPMGVPQTTDGGTMFGINPGGQGDVNFSIVADPTNPNLVYIGGDRQPVTAGNSLGAADFSGRLFRGTFAAAGSTWASLTNSDASPNGGGTASNSSPHADSRRMTFDADGNLIEGDDGGIYLRTRPQDNAGDWFSDIGNLRVTEFHDVAYDSVSHEIIGGAQDTGSPQQTARNGQTWSSVPLFPPGPGIPNGLFSTGDGGDVAVDNLVGGGQSVRYSSSDTLGNFRRQTYDATGTVVEPMITGATDVAGMPITITTAAAHGINNGDMVSIQGVLGNVRANGFGFTASNVTATTFQINRNGTGLTPYTGGGIVRFLQPARNPAAGSAALVAQFVTPLKTSAVGPNRLLIGGGNALYESTNRGTTITEIQDAGGNPFPVNSSAYRFGLTDASMASPIVVTSAGHNLFTGDQVFIEGVRGNTNANGLWTITRVTADTFSLNGSTGNAAYTTGGIIDVDKGQPLAYGGTTAAGVAIPGAFYVGSANQVFVRTTNAGAVATTNPGGGTIRGVVMDPTNLMTAYAVDFNHVYMTTNGGGAWMDITGNLLAVNNNLRSVEIIKGPGGAGSVDALLVGGALGVSRLLVANPFVNPPVWSRYGTLLANAPVTEMAYNQADNVLLVGTLGRGAWTVPNVRATAFTPGKLVVNGDMDFPNENDVIVLQTDPNNPLLLDIFLNNNTGTPDLALEWASVQEIDLNGLGGDDQIFVRDIAPGVTVFANGGTGNDAILVGSPTRGLDGIQGTLNVSGGAAGTQDFLVVNDVAGSDTPTYTITDATIARTGASTINYMAVENVVVNTVMNAGVTVNVQKTNANARTDVNLLGKNNKIVVGNAGGTLDDIQGKLFINGQNALKDQLTINDQNAAAARTYNVTNSSVTRTGSATINYGNIGQLTLNAGMGNNTINIASTSGGTANVFNGGPGDDSFVVGNAANSLDDIQGDLTVNGLAHMAGDTLTVNDQGSAGGKMYTLTATTFARAGGPTITYGTIEKLVLNPAGGGSVLRVQATAAATPATVDGAGAGTTLVGSDSLNLWTVTGADSGTLFGTAIAGLVSFNGVPNLTGGSDTDLFHLDDGQSVSGNIDGGGGSNTLDYGAYTSNVVVDLPLAQGTGVGGTLTNIQDVIGGNGTGYNILVGNGGNVLTGGSCRNLLIAGGSASTLNGGSNDDILIGGTTSYDLNLTALKAIMNEWTTPGESYATRVDHLMNGGGVNDPYRLNVTTVTSNGGHNQLIGGPGQDLFFGSLITDTTDRDPSETFVSI